MSTSAPPPDKSAPPPPLAPPDEQFWDRYSPHHEFPLSSVGSVALHIGALVLFVLALWLLSGLTLSDKTPVPMRTITLADGDGVEGKGGGGGTDRKENIDPIRQNVPKDVPRPKIEQVVPEIKQFLPKVADQNGPKPEDLKNIEKYAGLDPDLARKLLEGASGKKGTGPGDGTGGPGPDGAGGGNKGDASSSANRGIRWELNFKTASGKDYFEQLQAMKATLLIPEPTDFKVYKAYRLATGSLRGEDYDIAQLPGLHFIDDDDGSARRLAQAMGLGFSPPRFLAFFPKDIEDELAKKEHDFRGRKESEIFSTSFRILIRDGKPAITVISQEPVRR